MERRGADVSGRISGYNRAQVRWLVSRWVAVKQLVKQYYAFGTGICKGIHRC